MTPKEMIIDSRGVVYGSLGMTEEAAADFQAVLAWAEENPVFFPPTMAAVRQEWLTSLEAGENPFAPEVLGELRLETIDPGAFPEPEMLENYSRGHFVESLENDGFVLVDSGMNNNGVEYHAYGLIFDECTNFVILFGPEDMISEAKMILDSCTADQSIAEMRWFARMLIFPDPWADIDSIMMGEYLAWELIVLEDLVNGEITETGDFAIDWLDLAAYWEVDEEGNPKVTIYGW